MNTFSRNVRANENVFPRTFRRGDFPGEFAPWGPMHILCTRAVMHFSCDYMDSTQKSDWRFFFSPRVSNLLSFLMPCELLPITVSSLLLVSHYFILSFSSFPFLPCLSFFFFLHDVFFLSLLLICSLWAVRKTWPSRPEVSAQPRGNCSKRTNRPVLSR